MYYIVGNTRTPIDWNASGTARIAQNVQNLLCTWLGEVAYERTKGIDPGSIDKPFEEAKLKMKSEIYRVISTYEPLAEIREVTITGDHQGDMSVKVGLNISLSEESTWQN